MRAAAAEMSFDQDFMRGVVLIALFIGFIGIFLWAWSSKRKPAFRDASRLPLEEDSPADPGSQGAGNGAKE